MSKKKKESKFLGYTDLELARVIDKQWGEEVTHVAPLDELTEDGKKQFSCIDLGVESTLTIDKEGWVIVRPNDGGFADVLGTIKK